MLQYLKYPESLHLGSFISFGRTYESDLRPAPFSSVVLFKIVVQSDFKKMVGKNSCVLSSLSLLLATGLLVEATRTIDKLANDPTGKGANFRVFP